MPATRQFTTCSQHADSDPAFQRRCLDLLTAAVERAEASVMQQAYLTDRVLLDEGKPQEYGRHAPEPMPVPCPACQAAIEALSPDAGETRAATCPEYGQALTFRTAG